MIRELVDRNTRFRMLIPILLALAYLGPSAAMPWVLYNLRSVHVTDAKTAMDANVDVVRVSHLSFLGSFDVTFRGAADDLPVCLIKSHAFDYLGGKSDPIHKPLWWWADGRAKMQACMDDGLSDGRFYAVTCHNWRPFDVATVARRCKRSNVFRIGDEK